MSLSQSGLPVSTAVTGYRYTTNISVCLDYLLSKIRWLDNIGRRNRSHKNTKLENLLTEMQRLTLVHEHDSNGESHYRIQKDESNKEGSGSATPAKTEKH